MESSVAPPLIKGSMKVELYDSGAPDPNYEIVIKFPTPKRYEDMDEIERKRHDHKKMLRNIVGELDLLVERTGFEIVQENGQRRYAPPLAFKGLRPKKGAEIFVGKLPRDIYENELVPLFETVGRIYELRLMMEFNGLNRGFCFISYFNPAHAELAIKTFDNYTIRKGRQIGVVRSMNNCSLFFGGFPKDKTPAEVEEEIRKNTAGVTKVTVYPSSVFGEVNRGYAFAEYESHKVAAKARRRMIPGNLLMFGKKPHVDWADDVAEPEERRDRKKLSSSTSSSI